MKPGQAGTELVVKMKLATIDLRLALGNVFSFTAILVLSQQFLYYAVYFHFMHVNNYV